MVSHKLIFLLLPRNMVIIHEDTPLGVRCKNIYLFSCSLLYLLVSDIKFWTSNRWCLRMLNLNLNRLIKSDSSLQINLWKLDDSAE